MPTTAQSPFTAAPLVQPGFIQRLLKRPVKENAKVELQSLLAARHPDSLAQAQVSELALRYRLSAGEVASLSRAVFRNALVVFASDNTIAEDEAAYLASLKRLLSLSDSEVKTMESEVLHPKYQRFVRNIASDNVVDDDELLALKNLQSRLRISDEVADQLRSEPVTDVLQRVLDTAVQDHRLTPGEEQQLKTLAEKLGATVSYNDATRRQLARYSLFWRIENGELPEVAVDLHLQKNERCHYTASCQLLELRTVTKRIGYHGPMLRIPIAKGLSYRIGSFSPMVTKSDQLQAIDEGTLYVTSKRLLFDGTRKNVSVRLSSIISYNVFSDGVVVDKQTGRSPHFMFEGDTELCGVILGELLARS